ncbi:MAG TPA: hypothetical protein VN742_11900, partial [Candidatus Binataceae bacterium]|nr:hypothetical protein [Candidatus Binataceae bacterium]
MAKEKPSQIDARLCEGGFDPGAAPEQAVATLRALRGTAGVTDAMIAQALGGIVAPAAAALLVEMEAGASGATRREIRRALFKLRQRGVEVHAAGTATAPEPVSDSGLTGLLSPADAAGARIAWLLKARGGGGLRRLWCLVSESEGLLGATLEPLTRKEYRADRAEIERRAGTPLIDADWRLVDFVLCEAYRRTPEERRGRVGNFLTIRTELVASAPVLDFHHPIYDELAAQLAAEPSADLMQEADVAGYQLPPAAIKPYAEEATNLRQSVIVLSRMQQEERVATVVERALTDLLVGDLAYRLRRHLEDTAYFFARSGKPAQAGWAAAAAARLRDGAELKRSAFFQAFMRAQLGAIL